MWWQRFVIRRTRLFVKPYEDAWSAGRASDFYCRRLSPGLFQTVLHRVDGGPRDIAARFFKLDKCWQPAPRLVLHFAQADPGSSTILRNEFDPRFFEGTAQFHYCPFLCRQRARLNFKPFHAGKRHSGCLGEVALLPSK